MIYDFDVLIERRGSDSIKWAKYASQTSAQGENILPMWVADMDFAAPPEILAALQERLAHGVLGYGHTTTAFTDAIIYAMQRDYGWTVQADWIVPLSGLVSGLHIAARAIGERGDAIFTATPVYSWLYNAVTNMERKVISAPLRENANWSWDFAALEAALHNANPHANPRGLFLCHPHNPIGRIWREDELQSIARYAKQHDLVVVSDEIHCELILESKRQHRPFASLGPDIAARTITLMAPSKTYNIPGLGAAFAIIPQPALRHRFLTAMQGIVPHLNILGMAATIAAYTKCSAWRGELLAYLRGNRDRVMTLDGVGGLRVIKPEATYLAWLDCRALDIPDPADFFTRAGVGLSDGREFYPARDSGFLRLNFGCPRATLDMALQRIRQALLTR